MAIVKLNVSGVIYEVDADLFIDGKLVNGSQEKLPHLVSEAAKTGSTLTFQRPVTSFAAILEYYQTGELHMPTAVCPASFKKELEFWEVEEHLLQECCRIKFRSFLEEQCLLQGFRHEIQKNEKPLTQEMSMKQRIWSIVDNHGTSTSAKIYYSVTMVATIACILCITLGTDSCCNREATFCEVVEYVSFTNKQLHHALRERVEDLHKCQHGMVDDDDITLPPSVVLTEDKTKYHIMIFLKPPNDTLDDSLLPPAENNVLPQHPPGIPMDAEYEEYTVRKLFLPDRAILITEYCTIIFFMLDYLFRLGSCPSLFKFFKSALNVIDLAALIGSVLALAIEIIRKDQKYVMNWVDMLAFIQVFRALRLFRLVKNLRTSQVLAFSLRRNLKNMSILLVFILIFVCTFGSLIFFTETRQVVPSILDGWWWSIVTLSTVGYGDIVPETLLGRTTGTICAITGIWLLAMTLPIFVNDFALLHQYPCVDGEDVGNVTNEVSFDDLTKSEEKGAAKNKCDITNNSSVTKVTTLFDGNFKKAWIDIPEKNQ